jgi:Carboxypeptidase regulatory-like domain
MVHAQTSGKLLRVKGTAFSPNILHARSSRALQAAEKLDLAQTLYRFVTGHDFSRADKPIGATWASAPAEFRSNNSPELQTSSGDSLAAAGSFLPENSLHAARLKPRPFKTISLASAFVLSALLISCSALAQTGSQNAPLPSSPTTHRIAGTVVNSTSGAPLRHATVAILSEEDSHTIAAVESDDEGHFSLDHLSAAKYQLTASKRGFRTAFYDEHQEFNSAIVTGPGQETDNLTFRLVPGAILLGTVSTEGGDPVDQARVMLFLKSHNGKPDGRTVLAANTATDDTGAYEFSNLAAGDYQLAVMAEPWYAMHRASRHLPNLSRGGDDLPGAADPASALDVAYPITYFDSTTDEASASRIQLAGGSRVEANITLHAVPALHIEVNTPRKEDGSVARAELRQTVFGTVVGAESAGFLDPQQTGTTEFDGVSPGHYELAQGDPPHIVEMDATSNQQVDPSQGTATVAVRGTLQTTSGAPLGDDCTLSLDAVDDSQFHSSIPSVCMHGAFTFPSVPPGQWMLTADSGGKALSVASVATGSKARAGNLITVGDKSLSIAVAVSQSSTRLGGFARREGKGVAGVMVVLVPRQMAALDSFVRRDQSDSDGSFSLREVVPGDYTVVAIQDGWELDWAQPQVIARYLPGGVAVTVTDSSGKAIELRSPVPVQDR